MRTILGIDPGIADTGYGVIRQEANRFTLIAYGSIKTKCGLDLCDRLLELERELDAIIKKHKPDISGIEELFFCNNAKTAFMVGQARGVVLLTLVKNKVPIFEFTPLEVKMAVSGYGKADKKQVQQMVKIILKLDAIPKPDDAADALAVAVCAANS